MEEGVDFGAMGDGGLSAGAGDGDRGGGVGEGEGLFDGLAFGEGDGEGAIKDVAGGGGVDGLDDESWGENFAVFAGEEGALGAEFKDDGARAEFAEGGSEGWCFGAGDFGGWAAEKLAGFGFVGREDVDFGEKAGRERLGGGGVEDGASAALARGGKGALDGGEWGFELKEGAAGVFKDGEGFVNVGGGKGVVGAGGDDDGVAAGALFHPDEGDAGGGGAGGANKGDIDSGIGEAVLEFIGGGVVADAAEHADAWGGGETGGGAGLIGAFAAWDALEVGAEGGLARCRQTGHRNDEIHVEGAGNDD
jgi:hypothetical protein